MTLSAGTRLGPYEILSPLGAGGMGEVYRARDPRLGREVALKVLPAALSADADRLRRFEQEARAAGALSHPNLLTIYDVGTAEVDPHRGAPYLVSELLEGETLRERLSGGVLPVRKAIDYAIQAAHGLAAAHEKGIVHRDLKPENLFVTQEGRLKILDFGLAKLKQIESSDGRLSAVPTTPMRDGPGVVRGTEPGVVMGTMGYMSPEQVRALPVDPRSDLFSLGAILYEMLSGRRAFHGATAADTMSAILKEDPPELGEPGGRVPPALARVVGHCLEKNPLERYQSARDLAFALETVSGISSGSGAVAAEAGALGGSRLAALVSRWLSRSGAVRAAIGVVLLAAIFTIGFLTASFRRSGGSVPEPPSFTQLTFRRGYVPSARFAPDGRSVVYTATWDGAPLEIFQVAAGSPESRPLGIPGGFVLGVSRSGEIAMLSSPRAPENFSVPKGTLARVPLAGGGARELLEDVRYADWSPDGKDIAVIREEGGKSLVELPIGQVIYETSNILHQARVSPDGRSVALIQQSPQGISIVIVERSGRSQPLSGTWEDWWNIAWSPDGTEVWFVGARKNTLSLYALSLDGRERLLLRVPGVFEIHDVSRDGRVLLGRVNLRRVAAISQPGEAGGRDLSWRGFARPSELSTDGKVLIFTDVAGASAADSSVLLRGTDGSPAVRLGEGRAMSIASDGRWVLAHVSGTPPKLVALPRGTGQPKPVDIARFEALHRAAWFPDAKRILLSAREPGHLSRLYVQNMEGGEARPISPEGVGIHDSGLAVSPDGRLVAAIRADESVALVPVDGGVLRSVAGLSPGDRPIQWSADGRYIYTFRQAELPAQVFRVDLVTGRKELVREIRPADPAGVSSIRDVLITPDGRTCVYSYTQILSDLYLAEGIR